LASEVEKYLERVSKLRDSVKHEDGLPETLLERLSEAASLLNTIPQQLEERQKYILDNKEYGILLTISIIF
jgi:nesprin-1